ncbi:MAG: 2-oxo acid dehydrogenase subunit E2 [Spirochaetales bacterium]|nr:2-oxo acid dehydrogenase subunit E2 [Spirochaetales bacterium]
MGILITMPRYGANMDEGLLASWAVQEGDTVSLGQVICEIEIEKLTNEMEAPEAGVIRKILCDAGETLPCGAPLAVLAGADEDISGLLAQAGISAGNGPNEEPVSPSDKAGRPASVPAATAGASAAGKTAGTAAGGTSGSGFPGEISGIRITPKALKLAEEMGVDYRGIRGTGILGAVTREDIRAQAGKAPAVQPGASVNAGAAATISPAKAPASVPAQTGTSGVAEVRQTGAGNAAGVAVVVPVGPSAGARMTGIRKVTARRMMESLSGSAQTSIMMDADLTDLVAAYGRTRGIYSSQGIKLSYTAILLKATSRALSNHPIIRTIIEGEDTIRTLPDIDIALAVDADYGLTVPVIRHLDRKDLKTICRELSDTVSRAKAGTLSPDDMSGGAMTISNVGMMNVKYFTPILNSPQSAILGAGTLAQQPVVIGGGLHIRWILSLSLTYDHRIVDGAPAARFLNEIRGILESASVLDGQA